MKILPEPLSFVWDKGNKDKNRIKHDVSIKEAEEVFTNRPIFLFKDHKHSAQEERYMVWGITDEGREISAIFTLRKGKIRIISARDMHKKERRAYEEKIKTNSSI